MPFPASNAGKHFHDGMAIGKFHGVIIPTTPMGCRVVHAILSLELGRDDLAHRGAPLSGHEAAHVDGLLNVAAGLDEHLPGFPRDKHRELALSSREDVRGAPDEVGSRRYRSPRPLPLRLGGRGYGAIDVCLGGGGEGAEHLGGAGGVDRVEHRDLRFGT